MGKFVYSERATEALKDALDMAVDTIDCLDKDFEKDEGLDHDDAHTLAKCVEVIVMASHREEEVMRTTSSVHHYMH